MPIVNRVADLHNEITEWRRDFHAHPELRYDVHRTAGAVAEKLKSFGCDEVVPGIGRTGVVGVIRGRKQATAATRSSGCAPTWTRCRSRKQPACPTSRPFPARCTPAAMTATPRCCSAPPNISPRRAISPAPRWSYSSRPRRAAPAALAMVKDGLIERFGIEEVYGMHNYPGLPVGQFAHPSGPDDGGRRPSRDRDRGQGRARRAAASCHRHDPGRRADRSISCSRSWRAMSIR